MRRYVVPVLFGVGLAAAVSSAQAGDALPQDIAQRLDKAPVSFTMTAAKRERLMIIQENMARQRHYGRPYYGRPYGRYPGQAVRPYGYGGAYNFQDLRAGRGPYRSHRGYYGN